MEEFKVLGQFGAIWAEIWKNQLTFRGSLLEQVQIRLILLTVNLIQEVNLTGVLARYDASHQDMP